MESGTLQFTWTFSRPFATSTQSTTATSRIPRVFGGDPGPTGQRDRETAAVAVLEEQALSKHGKALLIYGAARSTGPARKAFGAGAGAGEEQRSSAGAGDVSTR